MKKLLILLFAAFLLAGCSNDNDTENTKNKETLTIYTTVFPLQYFAERIAGEHADVSSIYPPGADEHTFEPSQKDMIALAESDLFFYIGMGLEGFVDKAKSTMKGENVRMVAAAKDIHPEENAEDEHEGHEDENENEHEDGHNHGDVDPHVWLDPVYAKELAKSIKDELSKAKPNLKDEFEKNYTELIADLDELDQNFKETAANAKINKIIVSHSAFGYWESRYGIEQVPIAGMSTSSEPTQKDMEKIIKTINKYGIRYILVEQNVSSKLAEAISAETDSELLKVHNLSTRTDRDIKNKETYFTLMEKNLKTLEKAMN
ncbi:adhesin [Bacillus sp. FJAT-27225]|uniref:metal ABC transporter solute-binding protein, Zn/Mn family n=1 Tax=Bacillus sp. FJAT-27225 TaxID=1743144 RepID=UPI00080C32BB|nr:zinc ABC transporter substrate-binding protein [Bacillus sp. FJAT-27225]OCA91463.1 adhesin [Bacillus sp. FJAT-27225]